MTPDFKLVETNFDTFISESGHHFLKTNSANFVPFDDVVEEIARKSPKGNSKNLCIHQESRLDSGEICLPEFKIGDVWNVHFERLFSANYVKRK